MTADGPAGDEIAVRASEARRVGEGRLATLGKLAWLPALLVSLLGPLAWISDEMLAVAVILAIQLAVVLGGAMLVAPAVAAWASATRARGQLRARFDRARGLRVAGVEVPFEALAMAWTNPDGEVEILTHAGDEITLRMEDAGEASALVGAIRAASDGRRAYPVSLEGGAVRLTRKAWAWLAPISLAVPFLWAGPEWLPALVIGAGAGWLGSRGTPRMRFGADGVAIEGRLRRRYVRYGDIERVSVARTLLGWCSVRLVLVGGDSVSAAALVEHGRARLVCALIEEGMRMHAAGAAAGAHVAELDRGALDAEGWRVRVEGVAKERGYRGAALDAERLMSLMRNPAATPEQRVAAALALRADRGGVARIRVAAEVSAEPAVREALEQLAEEELDEPRLQKLLGRLAV